MIVATAFGLFVTAFAVYHETLGGAVAALAIVPVIGASWYFGIRGGILTALYSILANALVQMLSGHSIGELYTTPGSIIGDLVLILVSIVIGGLATVSRERKEALVRLETLDRENQARTSFLESLNEITRIALEAQDLDSVLKIMVERIALLFGADDGFLALWDESKGTPVPRVAYGSMKETYPRMSFEPGERTLGASLMEVGKPLAITNLGNSPYVDPKVSSKFPSHSMLGLPLIVGARKLAILYLGYNRNRTFDAREITHAQIAAQQIALVLTKMQLLESAHRQVLELTALHDVALASIQVDNEDQLIDHVTEVIGRNLFPDNFGILLLDEPSGLLHAHASYHFFTSSEEFYETGVPLGRGITGRVAETGQPQRIGNVHEAADYLNMDERTMSELCVPIKIKDRVLGVVNAESTRKEAFSIEDERLLVTLAGHLATSIEQLRAAQAERRWLDQLAHSNDLIYSLAHVTARVERALSPEEIIQVLGDELNRIDLTCVTAGYDASRKRFTMNYSIMKPEALTQIENAIGFPLIEFAFPRERMSAVDDRGLEQPVVIPKPEDEIQFLFDRGPRAGAGKILEQVGFGPQVELMRLPLMFEENLLGVLWVWGKGLCAADLPVMSIFAKQIGISLERARLFQEVQSLALTDPLTGLHNRRSLFELGRIEFSRAHRMSRPFGCMLLDLDHFKQINDNYGHPIGDLVLQEFAKRCKKSVREIDLVGRYGGEEIIILLPETDRSTTLHVAERLRKTIAETPMSTGDYTLDVTVSIGVAEKDENTRQLETLIARADQAMYIAKHKGRNRVAMSK